MIFIPRIKKENISPKLVGGCTNIRIRIMIRQAYLLYEIRNSRLQTYFTKSVDRL